MSYADSRSLADNSEFQIRVKYGMRKAATDIAGGASSGVPAIDAKREALAKFVLEGGRYQDFIDTLAALEPTNTDEGVNNAIASIWNDMAGVTLADAV